jgi:hypothetical protein
MAGPHLAVEIRVTVMVIPISSRTPETPEITKKLIVIFIILSLQRSSAKLTGKKSNYESVS